MGTQTNKQSIKKQTKKQTNKQAIPFIYDFWGFKKLILRFLGFQTSDDITDSISMCVEVLKVLRKKAIMYGTAP